MTNLVLAAAFFAVLHAGLSGTGARDALVRRVGEGAYLGLFSTASFVGIVWLSVAWSDAPYVPLWSTPAWIRWLAPPVVLVATVLVVLGLTTPNPAAVGGERALRAEEPATGILRVTRHPFLCGVAIWAAMHLAANGEVRSVVLFGTLLAVAVNGMRSIDRKRRRLVGEPWRRYEAVTSAVPGAAILAGRTRFVGAEIGWGGVGLAVVVFAVLLLMHPIMFGVVPWPRW
jgi:uncharacterized membrane protein